MNGRLLFQRMDDSLVHYSAQINDKEQTITATTNNNAKNSLTFHRVSPAELTLDGTMDGHKLHLQLRLEDRNHFLLVNRGFHWVQEFRSIDKSKKENGADLIGGLDACDELSGKGCFVRTDPARQQCHDLTSCRNVGLLYQASSFKSPILGRLSACRSFETQGDHGFDARGAMGR